MDRLHRDWEWTGRTAAAREALHLLAASEPLVAEEALAGAADLFDLVAALHRARSPAERDRAAQIVQAMLRGGRGQALVARAIVQAMVPGLVGLARRLAWGGGDWPDTGSFLADAVATAWEIVVSWAGQDRPYAVLDILSAVRSRLRRRIVRQRNGTALIARGAVEQLPEAAQAASTSAFGATAATELEGLAGLIEDLRGRGLHPTDAAVVYGRDVLGLTLSELSLLSGRSRRHLSARHRRAALTLCAT